MNPLRTDFLFARPSFLSGMARVLDLVGCFDSYNESRSTEEADARAMYADWRIVGQDIHNAAGVFEQQIQSAREQQLSLPLAR